MWFGVTFGVIFFARDLGALPLRWSFSFWMASQGVVIVYAVIVWVYARLMAKIDDQFDPAAKE